MAEAPDPYRLPDGAAGLRHARMGNALCVGSMMLWAAGFPAAEILLETWSTLALISARLLMAVIFLLIVWALIEGPHKVVRARWGRGLFVGALGFGIGTWMLLKAQALTDPVTVAIFASTAPLTATLVEKVQDGRRISARFALGILAAVAGGLVASAGGAGLSADIGWGALGVFLSSLLFSWGSHAAVREFPDLSPLGRSAVTLTGALLFCGTIFVVAVHAGFDQVPSAPIDARQITMLVIYSVAAMALSQILWISSVGRLGVALASFHMNVAPFYVMVIMLVLGAMWSWPQAIGAAIVGCGVIVAQRR